jgi:transposase
LLFWYNHGLVKYTITQFLQDYPNEDACLDELFRNAYGEMPFCPKCGVVSPKYHKVKKRKSYACQDCGNQIYPLAGTIFAYSKTSLVLWFYALYLFSTSRNGVAARELQRQLGVTYKTAWRMARQIRLLMGQDTEKLSGIVEADEAYIGGRRRSSNRYSNKTPLLGVVERKGRVRVVATDHASASTAIPFLRGNVEQGATLNTDESRIYSRAKRYFEHDTVQHGTYEFVRDDTYTNSIEGFWGLLKPSLTGTHRAVSKAYLQQYVNEHAWRYNHRKSDQSLYRLLIEEAGKPLR